MTRLLYFAYGSNLHPARLQERIGDIESGGIGCLRGYRLEFNKRDKDGSSKCNLMMTGQGTDQVWGAVYRISLDQLKDLMQHESGYRPSAVTLEVDSKVRAAATFIAQSDFVDDSLKPFGWYHQFVLSGLEYLGLPAEYTERIRQVSAVRDLEESRSASVEQTQSRINQYHETTVV